MNTIGPIHEEVLAAFAGDRQLTMNMVEKRFPTMARIEVLEVLNALCSAGLLEIPRNKNGRPRTVGGRFVYVATGKAVEA